MAKLSHIRNRYLFLLDAVTLSAAPLWSYFVRFEGFEWGPQDTRTALLFVVFSVPIKLAILQGVGLYRRLWRHAGVAELERILLATTISALSIAVLGAVVLPTLGITPLRVPLSVLFIDACLTAALVSLPRLLVRLLNRRVQRRRLEDARRVLIVGAGAAGEMIVKELMSHPQLGLNPVAFVDDDRTKHGHRMCDLPVLGPLARIPELARRLEVEEIIIAMPRAPGSVVREVVRASLEAGVKTRTVPGMFDILSGRVAVASLRQVEIQDLLRREPIQTDLDQVRVLATGETVLVTGAGGSIGGELCRQLARLEPAQVILLGHGENSIFDIMAELGERYPNVTAVPIIADVRNRERLRQVFEQYKPYSVFHAAAHKHVPLMERNVAEAIINNVLGTKNVVEAAAAHGAERFIFISTDKAVSPKTVMGQSKALCEWIVEAFGAREDIATRFVAVRFGNVLGSSGSVIPIFRRQIAKGGPVTVTHPEMTRYFMTIPEAASLVVQAGSIGGRGDVFVLDMGEPVRILDLAMQMIRLSGKDPERDIDVEIVGTRPGEKLHEELWGAGEVAESTVHPKIMRVRGPIVDAVWLQDELAELERLVREGETLETVSRLATMMRAPRLVGGPVTVDEDTLSGQKL
jgi:FlaA1/EpsC-like NDP-sugar epimerase